jgi:colicin import membrane protein
MAASKTRTRKPTASAKSKQTADEKKAAAAKKAEAEEAAKAKREAKAAEAKAKKEAAQKERDEKRAAKEKEASEAHAAAIESGALIIDGSTEYHAVEREEDLTVETRAAEVVKALKDSKTPVSGKALQEQFDGGWPQYLSFFAMLKSLELVREYRSRTGERGGSGVAYLWIG